MRKTHLALLLGQFFHRGDRVGNQLIQRQGAVSDTVHERGVGAVFQQTTHKIRQQRFVGADRRVDTARAVEFAIGDFTGHLLVQRLAHAVQALEFVLSRVVVLPGQLINCRQGVSVMGRELRIDQARHRQQLFRTGQIGDVGVDLAGIDRIAFETVHLRAFDFAVPVGAFNQTNHQAATAAGREVDQVVNHERAAFLIGLDHKANPVPARQLRFKAEFFQQIERDLQAIGLFGVNVDTDIVLARQQGQRFQARV